MIEPKHGEIALDPEETRKFLEEWRAAVRPLIRELDLERLYTLAHAHEVIVTN